MPQHPTPHGRICKDCDGHPVAHITTGHTNPDGTRHTLPVTCPTCKGTGTHTTTRTLTQAGR